MTTKFFKAMGCFQSLYCIVKSVTRLEILNIDAMICEYSKYWTDLAWTGVNSLVRGSNNYFKGLTATLLLFQYVKATLSWVWRDSKKPCGFNFILPLNSF